MLYNQTIQDFIEQGIFTSEDIENMNLPIRLRKGTMRRLYQDLTVIKKACKESCKNHTKLTNNDLFQKSNPLLFELYRRYYEKAVGLSEAEKINQAYKDLRYKCIEELLNINDTQDPSIADLYRQVSSVYVQEFDFENRDQSLEAAFDELMQSVDFSTLSLDEQKEILDHLLQFKDFVELTITCCEAVNETWLKNLATCARKSGKLSSLTLIDCKNVTVEALAKVVYELPNIELAVSQTENFSKESWPVLVACSAKKFTLILKDKYKLSLDRESPLTTRGALVLAAKDNSFVAIQYLLALGFKFSQTDSAGYTPLHYAAKNGNPNIVQLLLALGADVNSVTPITMYTPVYLAAAHEHTEIVKMLLGHMPKLDVKTNSQETVLHAAAYSGSVEMLTLLSSAVHPSIIQAKDSLGKTLLHYAAANPNLSVLEHCLLLPQFEGLINSPDKLGNSPLHIAAAEGTEGHIKHLIASGAKLDLLNVARLKPVDIANTLLSLLNVDRLEVVDTPIVLHRKNIIKCFPEPAQTPTNTAPAAAYPNLRTDLHTAIEKEDFDKISTLLAPNNVMVDVNSRIPENGYTALHFAAQGPDRLPEHYETMAEDSKERYDLELKYICCMESLLLAQADINAKTEFGDSPLQLAVRVSRSRRIIECLIKHGANQYCQDNNGNTLMHEVVSVIKNQYDLLRLLLNLNLRHLVNVCNQFKAYPLHHIVGKQDYPDQIPTFELLVQSILVEMKLGKWRINYFDEQKNEAEEKALHLAAMRCNYKIFSVVLKNTIKFDEPNILGESPLHLAIKCYATLILNLKVAEDSLTQPHDESEETILEKISNCKKHIHDAERVIQALLRRGSNVYRRNNEGKTPLDLASPFIQIFKWVRGVAQFKKATADSELHQFLVNAILDEGDFYQLYQFVESNLTQLSAFKFDECKVLYETYKKVYQYILGQGSYDNTPPATIENMALRNMRQLQHKIDFLKGQLILQPGQSQIIQSCIEFCERVRERARNRMLLKSMALDLHLYYRAHSKEIQQDVSQKKAERNKSEWLSSAGKIYSEKPRGSFFPSQELNIEKNKPQLEQLKEFLSQVAPLLEDETLKGKAKGSNNIEEWDEIYGCFQQDKNYLENNNNELITDNLSFKIHFYQSAAAWLQSLKTAPVLDKNCL